MPAALPSIVMLSTVILYVLYFLGVYHRMALGQKLNEEVVATKYGALRGLLVSLQSRHLQDVVAYLGIPYASPPVGNLRFMPPVTPPRWSGIRNADFFGQVCPQRFPNITNEKEALKHMPRGRYEYLKRLLPSLQNQSEDCLYLNIYVPYRVSSDKRLLPVMVYIHGESYEWNSGNPYDGSLLASYGNVVIVTINYRLGILGFFSTGDTAARGNYGLSDQVAALHWIEENISRFGGDQSNVTIFGQGYGAACVSLLMISPVAEGLFHRAILQSGTSLSSWAISMEPMKYALALADGLKCPKEESAEIVTCLKTKSIEEILALDIEAPRYLSAFAPSVDGILIPNDPHKIMQNYNSLFGKYDLLFGVTKNEAYFYFNSQEIEYGFEENKRDRILRTFVRNLFNYHLNEVLASIVNEYTDWNKPFQHPIAIRDATMEALGDAQVIAPAIETGNYHSTVRLNSYFYVFGYQSRDGHYPASFGCVHGEELPYVFGAPLSNGLSFFHKNYTRGERMISEAVMRYWTNFAKTGDPNKPEGQTTAHGPKSRYVKLLWPQYETVHQKYLNIGMKPKVRHHYRAHKLALWMKFLPEIHKAGGVSVDHHLLPNHNDPNTYDGHVRDNNYTPFPPPPIPPSTTPPPWTLTNRTVSEVEDSSKITTRRPVMITMEPEITTKDNTVPMSAVQSPNYSTVLSVTIAVGCSLLILNVLIFAGVYYQRDKNRLEAKLQKRNMEMKKRKDIPEEAQSQVSSQSGQMQTHGTPQKHARAPPPSPSQTGAHSQESHHIVVPPPPPPPSSRTPARENTLPEAQPLLPQPQAHASTQEIRVQSKKKRDTDETEV